MRAVLQRVRAAGVSIGGQQVSRIGPGLMVLLGVCEGDTAAESAYLARKVAELRIFPDQQEKLNLSLLDVGGQALVVSNFTLYGDCRKGRRPSYTRAARPEVATPLYEDFCRQLAAAGVGKVETGVFGADMLVQIENDGPVTLILDTQEIMPGAKEK